MQRYQREDLLTASEIARYVYCNRAWGYDQQWLASYRRRRFAIRFAVGFIGLVIIALSLSQVLGY